jgi:hypothetical protein
MAQPFEVGKNYRNRNGEYTVLAIDGDRMKIRYTNGHTVDTSAGIQGRIWENIQFEEQLAREEERERLAQEARVAIRKRTARAPQTSARTAFAGFQGADFEPKKRGIAWSTRQKLGKLLAHRLSVRTKASFDSWPVPHESQVHIARKEYYDPSSRETQAALFVSAEEEGVTYGFRVSKPAGKVRVAWPWAVFVAALSDDDDVYQGLRSAMEMHELNLDVYAMEVSFGPVGHITVSSAGFLWQHETAEQKMARRMTREELVDYLLEAGSEKRCDLYVRMLLTVEDAVRVGSDIVEEISEVLEALTPLYDASMGS